MQSSRSNRIPSAGRGRELRAGLAALIGGLHANTAGADWGENWGEMTWGFTSTPVPVLDGWGLLLVSAGLLAVASLTIARHRTARTTLVMLVALALPIAAYAATISLPNTFVNGTPANANEVNANFDTLVLESNSQDARIFSIEIGTAAHLGDVSAHHTKTTNASELTSGTLADDRLSALVSLLGPSIGVGDLDFDPFTQTEAGSHAANASAHHVRYSDVEATAAVAAADPYVLNTGDTVNGSLTVDLGSAAGTALTSSAGSSSTASSTTGVDSTALGTSMKYGGKFQAGSTTSPTAGSAYGIAAYAHGTDAKIAGYFYSGSPIMSGLSTGVLSFAHSSDSDQTAGVFRAGSDSVAAPAYGVDAEAYGASTKYAGNFAAGSDSTTGDAYGVNAEAYGTSAKYGGSFTAGNEATPTAGTAYGVSANAFGTSTKYGGFFIAGNPFAPTDGLAKGIQANAFGTSTKYGGSFTVGSSVTPTAGNAYGIKAAVHGTSTKYGVDLTVGNSSIAGPAYGVRSYVRSSDSLTYGGYFYASAFGTGDSYGVYGRGETYDFYAAGPGIDYGAASSARWKQNVQPIADPLGKVERLRGVSFDWDAEHGGEHDVGMIAEEVGEVLPEIVEYEENGIDAIGMDYSKLTPLLVEAVKALAAENRELKQQLAELGSRVKAVETANTGNHFSAFALQ